MDKKYWLVCWIGCCVILTSIFYNEIQHQKKIDIIFEKYYKEINKL